MIVAAAYVPATPLLVPEVASGAAAELDDLRTSCRSAMSMLTSCRPDRVVVLGAGALSRHHGGDRVGSFAGFGVGIATSGMGAADLPPSLAVGAWLLDDCGCRADRASVEVADGADDAEIAAAADLARQLVGGEQRVGLLVVGDGSATRTEKAPRGYDERGAAFDDLVAGALGSGDLTFGQLSTDHGTALATELSVGGLATWLVTARVLAEAGPGTPTAAVLWEGAPYGVGYLVAVWTWPEISG